jgi:hypothetical protein
MRAIHLDVAEVALVPLRLRVTEVAAVLSRSSVAPQAMRPAFCTMAHSRRFSSTVIGAPSAAHFHIKFAAADHKILGRVVRTSARPSAG